LFGLLLLAAAAFSDSNFLLSQQRVILLLLTQLHPEQPEQLCDLSSRAALPEKTTGCNNTAIGNPNNSSVCFPRLRI